MRMFSYRIILPVTFLALAALLWLHVVRRNFSNQEKTIMVTKKKIESRQVQLASTVRSPLRTTESSTTTIKHERDLLG